VKQTIVDNREHNNKILTRLKELGIDYEIRKLPVGDFIFGNWVIERKSINDFLNSGSTGRLYDQLENMVYNLSLGAERALLIIHGTTKEINRRYFTDIDLFAILGDILVNFANVQVIFLPSDIAVANTLASMYYKIYQPNQPVHTYVRRTKDPCFDVLRATKIFSIKQSRELLKHYSLQEIFNLPDKDLKEIKYIGNASAKKFSVLRKRRVNNG
jgi:ERCC4-type nuclease